MATPAAQPVIVKAAACWGATVLTVKNLRPGQSFDISGGKDSALTKPENAAASDMPVRAVGAGWELDARGATGGVLHLRGRKEDPVQMGASGAPIPIVAGDYGVLQYGSFAVFFQFVHAPPALEGRTRIEWSLILAFLFALTLIFGTITVMKLTYRPPPRDKPLELTSLRELQVRYNLDEEKEPPPTKSGDENDSGGSGIEDPGAKDKKEQGGGKKIAGAEGKLGAKGEADETRAPGEPGKLGGMSEVLASEVGDEVRETLSTISSVSDALGGLRSDNIVLGKGPGTGLKGSGSGGGGDGPGGVPFGSGTLDTGWGPGKGGGYGSGRGGPGGRGRGGRGRGGRGTGDGSGDGSGSGERKVEGGGKAKSGSGLTPAQIQRIVMSRYGAYRACYESAAARSPGLSGGVAISFTISPSGSVSSASVASNSLGNARVAGCILRQFKRLSFPSSSKPTNSYYPLNFAPSKKK